MIIYFSYLFFPFLIVTYCTYWFLLKKSNSRLFFIALFSTAIIALLHPIYSIIIFLFTLLVHLLLKLTSRGKINGRTLLAVSIVGGVSILLCGKYAPEIGAAFFDKNNAFFSYFIVPLGVSYYFFRIIQYSFDHYRGIIQDHSFLKLYAFVTFLPLIPAGPVETYQKFYGDLARVIDKSAHLNGLRRILVGLAKKMIVSDFLFFEILMQHGKFIPQATTDLLVPITFYYSAYAFLLYGRAFFDMAACADIAIGCSRLFGFTISENLNKPYLSKNLSDFWQRWHMTVSFWCRNNVFFPVFGLTKKVWLGLICSMLVMGLWHRINLNWLSWAILHGAALSAIYFLGTVKRKNVFLKKISATYLYAIASWLFTQILVAASHLLTLNIAYGRAFQFFLSALPSMAFFFITGSILISIFIFIFSKIRNFFQKNIHTA